MRQLVKRGGPGLAVFLGAALAGAAAAADTLGARVQVVFAITAPDFVRNLPAPASAEMQRRMASELAVMAHDHFGFVEWLSSPPPAGPPADAELRVTLVGEAREDGSRTSIELRGAVGGQPIEMPELPNVVVYELWDDKPTHDAAELRLKLVDVLHERLDNDDFRRRLQEQFLSQVPLSRRVVVRGQDKRLLVPASWKSLHARPDSMLRAVFSATPAAGAASEGQIRLSPEGPMAAEGLQDAVVCRIRQFTFPAVTVEGVEAWHERIPVLLGPGVLNRITVSMESYQREASRPGDLAVEPDR